MTARPNYRHSGARCCATCARRQIGFLGGYVCACGVRPGGMMYADWLDYQNQQPEIEPDYICDDWKSEVEK